MWQTTLKKKVENNPNHAPKGDSKGGQFTKGDGAGSGDDKKDDTKKDTPKGDTKTIKVDVGITSGKPVEIHKDGKKIVDAMIKSTPNETKNNPKGAVFLTSSGIFAGTNKGEHRASLKDALDKSGIKISSNDGDIDHANIVKLGLGITGMIRVSAGSTLTIDAVHPFTSSQRNALQDLIISRGYKQEDTVIDLNGKMAGKNPDMILRSIFTESKCPDCGEDVALSGDHSKADIGKKKKKRFEFVEAIDDSWREVEHYLIEDATNSGQKSDTVGNPEFKAFTHSSSFVGNVLWDRESREMDILLNGNKYHFCNVSERLFDSFEGAGSKGAFFNREIKTLHDC